MACYTNSVVQTAIAEIGYKETKTNKTKYAAYIDKNFPDFYNGAKQGVAWCDLFVDYCVLVNCADEKEAENVLCQPPKSAGAGCKYSYGYYQAAGRTGKEARVGAQIFFGSGKNPSHTGIVIDVTADSVITVEGNSDDMVKRHTYKKTSSKIFGYGYPRYAEEAQPEKPAEQPEKPAEAAAKSFKVKTNSGAPLRLRAQPTTNSEILALIPNGTKIESPEQVDGWAKTTYKGRTGYCSMKYLV